MKKFIRFLTLILSLLFVFCLSAACTAQEEKTQKIIVSFQTNGGSTISAVEWKEDTSLNIPDPKKEGFVFSGWFFDADCTQKADLSNLYITRDTTLYAAWTPQETKKYNYITLELSNGKSPIVLQTESGTPAQKPADPVYGNNRFLGWYFQGCEYDWSSPVKEDFTVIALWEKVYTDLNMRSVSGKMKESDGILISQTANTLYVCENADFDRGSIEVTLQASTSSDNGIVLCLSADSDASWYWEQDVSYYFFFVSRDGYAYLGKVDHGTWSALKVLPLNDYKLNNAYTLKAELDGTDIRCYVDNELYILYSEMNFLTGRGIGIRAGAPEVTFSQLNITGNVN